MNRKCSPKWLPYSCSLCTVLTEKNPSRHAPAWLPQDLRNPNDQRMQSVQIDASSTQAFVIFTEPFRHISLIYFLFSNVGRTA
ncbi:hypothetical protein Y032_0046g1418 [Ancylostoma ceylanicum]|uniref:Uncharacterized protein n=1 Tax=Ancylostoma ceylanicum TaxID=53326 RepID=A0A016UD38_9BILA|nr:hypothetical protein Y032_0046g1418 [Ancylostoma ceylanicum]